jgi:hypothetical protein
MQNARQHLDQLFNLNFSDPDQEFYFNQKNALKKGILFSPLNGQQINYLKSNQLISSEHKATDYLLFHAFYINEFSTLRNKLCKIIVFPEEKLLISFYHQGVKFKEETKKVTLKKKNKTFTDTSSSLKVSWHELVSSIKDEYKMQDITVEVKLITESLHRLNAEENDFIFDSFKAWYKICGEIKEKMEVLQILNKENILNERIKLWGFNSFSENILSSLTDVNFSHKNIFLIGNLNYHFLNDLSNEEISNLNSFEESYLIKAQLLSNQLLTKDVLWINT